MKTTTEIVNLVSKALRSRPIKWVDIKKDYVKFEYGYIIFRVSNELSVEEAKDSCLYSTAAADFLEELLKRTDKYEK